MPISIFEKTTSFFFSGLKQTSLLILHLLDPRMSYEFGADVSYEFGSGRHFVRSFVRSQRKILEFVHHLGGLGGPLKVPKMVQKWGF